MILAVHPAFKSYTSTCNDGFLKVELSFTGSAVVGVANPEKTNVRLTIVKKRRIPLLRNKTVISYGNLLMPDGAWHGNHLIEFIEDYIILGISTDLIFMNRYNFQIIKRITTGNTPIFQLLRSEREKNIIVQSGYYGFERPDSLGNISAYDVYGRERWRVECPTPSDIYTRPYYNGGTLTAYSWSSHICEIDEGTGRITSKRFTK